MFSSSSCVYIPTICYILMLEIALASEFLQNRNISSVHVTWCISELPPKLQSADVTVTCWNFEIIIVDWCDKWDSFPENITGASILYYKDDK